METQRRRPSMFEGEIGGCSKATYTPDLNHAGKLRLSDDTPQIGLFSVQFSFFDSFFDLFGCSFCFTGLWNCCPMIVCIFYGTLICRFIDVVKIYTGWFPVI
ncbi:hypothetical protein R6Q59_027638 [Mikania micrantha]